MSRANQDISIKDRYTGYIINYFMYRDPGYFCDLYTVLAVNLVLHQQ